MASFARFPLMVVCALVVACSKAEDPSVPPADSAVGSDTATSADTGSLDTSVADASSGPDTPDTAVDDSDGAEAPLDSSEPEAEVGPPPEPVDCFADDFGPSSAKLIDFFYQRQVGDCPSSECSDFFKFAPSCVLTLQVADVEHSATLDPTDCDKLTRWLTSDLLVSRLRDSLTCAGKVDGVFESTMLTLEDGLASKKTFMCSDEPFASHRACLAKLRDKYFPGI